MKPAVAKWLEFVAVSIDTSQGDRLIGSGPTKELLSRLGYRWDVIADLEPQVRKEIHRLLRV